MNNTMLQQRVTTEIENLHAFFVDWFGGHAPQSDALSRENLEQRFTPDFVLIPPGGKVLSVSDICASIRAGYGTNPDFKVAIRNVTVRKQVNEFVLLTYEEWQRNALNSTPPDNARVATVLLEIKDRILWHHIQETWLPADVMAAGPYSF